MIAGEALQYALAYGPSDETRKIACEDPWCALDYADDVDHGPRDDTRKAACGDSYAAYEYAHFVDKTARDDTWLASGEYHAEYMCMVPDAVQRYGKDWITANLRNYDELHDFCNITYEEHDRLQDMDEDSAVVYVLSIYMRY